MPNPPSDRYGDPVEPELVQSIIDGIRRFNLALERQAQAFQDATPETADLEATHPAALTYQMAIEECLAIAGELIDDIKKTGQRAARLGGQLYVITLADPWDRGDCWIERVDLELGVLDLGDATGFTLIEPAGDGA